MVKTLKYSVRLEKYDIFTVGVLPGKTVESFDQYIIIRLSEPTPQSSTLCEQSLRILILIRFDLFLLKAFC